MGNLLNDIISCQTVKMLKIELYQTFKNSTNKSSKVFKKQHIKLRIQIIFQAKAGRQTYKTRIENQRNS